MVTHISCIIEYLLTFYIIKYLPTFYVIKYLSTFYIIKHLSALYNVECLVKHDITEYTNILY